MNINTARMVVVGNNDNNHVSSSSSSSRANAAPPAELPIERSKSDAELVIQRAIEDIQRMIKPYAGDDDEEATKVVIEINPAMKKHWQSEIEILREAPRDEKKIREILKVKQKEYDKKSMIEQRIGKT
jgi:hypothetical protein